MMRLMNVWENAALPGWSDNLHFHHAAEKKHSWLCFGASVTKGFWFFEPHCNFWFCLHWLNGQCNWQLAKLQLVAHHMVQKELSRHSVWNSHPSLPLGHDWHVIVTPHWHLSETERMERKTTCMSSFHVWANKIDVEITDGMDSRARGTAPISNWRTREGHWRAGVMLDFKCSLLDTHAVAELVQLITIKKSADTCRQWSGTSFSAAGWASIHVCCKVKNFTCRTQGRPSTTKSAVISSSILAQVWCVKLKSLLVFAEEWNFFFLFLCCGLDISKATKKLFDTVQISRLVVDRWSLWLINQLNLLLVTCWDKLGFRTKECRSEHNTCPGQAWVLHDAAFHFDEWIKVLSEHVGLISMRWLHQEGAGLCGAEKLMLLWAAKQFRFGFHSFQSKIGCLDLVSLMTVLNLLDWVGLVGSKVVGHEALPATILLKTFSAAMAAACRSALAICCLSILCPAVVS